MISVSGFVQKEKAPFSGIVNAFLPDTVVIPFEQEYNVPSSPAVSVGDIVTEGQVIASTPAATIHASIPGVVSDICLTQQPNGCESYGARIHLQGSFSYRGKKTSASLWKNMTPDEIIRILSERGVINTFNVNKPSALSSDILHSKKLMIVRMYDEDPSTAVDSTLSRLFNTEIRTGAAITARAFGAAGIVFVYAKQSGDSGNKEDDAQLFEGMPVLHAEMNTRQYPCGFKRDIFAAIRKISAEEPFNDISLQNLYIDSLTLLHTYEAVVLSIPVINQYIHVTGNCLHSVGIIKVSIGTSLAKLAELCGGFKKEPSKIIVNGLLTGCAVSDLNIPVTSYVKSVAFMPEAEVPDQRQTTCIRCGRCRRICPRELCPDILYLHVSRSIPVDEVYLKTANLCSGCALCNAVCSARLPLTQTIALLKDDTNE